MTIVIATLSAISINFVMLYFFIFVILYVLDSVVYFYVFFGRNVGNRASVLPYGLCQP